MGKHNTISGILVFAVILMIAATTFAAVYYATGILTAVVAFVSNDQITKFQTCGIDAPAEMYKLRADIPGILFPAIYVGLPGLMILIAILMFIAGYYYGGGKEGHSVSETTTTTTSPNRKDGKYASGRHVEKTRTQKTSESEGE